jgi:hypothetical protein
MHYTLHSALDTGGEPKEKGTEGEGEGERGGEPTADGQRPEARGSLWLVNSPCYWLLVLLATELR